MKHIDSISSLVRALVVARKNRGLTQTDLGEKLGMPQSYISRFEGCSLDSRLTSVMEIARFLGLELVLVPVSLLPTVKAIVQPSAAYSTRPLYSLDDVQSEDDAQSEGMQSKGVPGSEESEIIFDADHTDEE